MISHRFDHPMMPKSNAGPSTGKLAKGICRAAKGTVRKTPNPRPDNQESRKPCAAELPQDCYAAPVCRGSLWQPRRPKQETGCSGVRITATHRFRGCWMNRPPAGQITQSRGPERIPGWPFAADGVSITLHCRTERAPIGLISAKAGTTSTINSRVALTSPSFHP